MEHIQDVILNFLNLMKTFAFKDLLDILALSIIIYGAIKLIRETRAGQLVKGLAVMSLAYAASYILGLKMLSTLLDKVFEFSFLLLLIMFQPELRRAMERLGHSRLGNYSSLIRSKESSLQIKKKCIKDVVTSVLAFKASKTGALIVFELQTKLGEIIDTGVVIDSRTSVSLIGSIFFSNAPLHDGALVIRNGRIHAAGCILPLSKNENISVNLGTRHRAALGISENSDAAVVVVSEETGNISFAANGILHKNCNKDNLKKKLEDAVLLEYKRERTFFAPLFRKVKKNEKI